MYLLKGDAGFLYFRQQLGPAFFCCLVFDKGQFILDIDEAFQQVILCLVPDLHHNGSVRQDFFDVFGLALTAGGRDEVLYFLEFSLCQANGYESLFFIIFHGKVRTK